MAKKAETENNERTFDAVAKQFIKYNGEYLEVGEKFQVKKTDVEELSKYAEIEIPKEEPPANTEGIQQGETGGE